MDLSAMQKGLLLDSLVAEKAVYVQQLACSLRYEVNVPAFQNAWQQIFDRHEVFRVGFRWQDVDEPVQEIHGNIPAQVRQVDLRHLPGDEQNKSVEEYLRHDRAQQFDLARPPLFRLALLQLAERHFCFVFTFHHSVLDGRSRSIVIEEVFRLYDALCGGSAIEFPAAIQFEKFIAWLNQQEWERAREYWKGLFKVGDHSSVMAALPGKDQGIPASDADRSWPNMTVPGSLTSRLQSVARQNGLTLNTLVQGCWAILLHRYSRQPTITIGVTRACRRVPLEGASEIVGLLINTVPVRARFGLQARVLEVLQDLRAQALNVRPFECTPFVKIQEFSGVDPALPLLETIAIFDDHEAGHLPGLATCQHSPTEVRRFGNDTYPLSLLAYGRPALYLEIGYDTGRFDPEFIGQMMVHYRTLLEQIPTSLDLPVGDLPLVSQREFEQIVLEWNRTEAGYPVATVHELFEKQAIANPHNIAVDFEGRQLTYQELNSRSNQLARYLARRGVGLEKPVGVYLERGLEMAVALLGILKAGGAYVPLDPNYPSDRLRFMASDAGIEVLLTQKPPSELDALSGGISIDLCGEWDHIARECHECDDPFENRALPENLAYIIYTSGSTGKPKGVAVEHRQVCNQLFWAGQALSLVPADRILQKASFSFDASILEIFLPLAYGCRMIVAAPGGEQDPDYLLRLAIEQEVTYCDLVPSLLEVMLTHAAISQWSSARIITCGADVLKPEVVRKCYTLLSCELWNTYGPTEATVQSTFVLCHAGDQPVPIGRPIANTRLYVLDQYQQPVPVGVMGELYIGGEGVARGYWLRPHVTAERFVPDRFTNIPGARLYRTGDIVRYRADGNLDFTCRIDQQVKIRGFRIELQEIEAVLCEHEAVARAVVLAVEDEPGNKRLCAFLVARPRCKPSAENLRSLLKSKLPGYMVPASFSLLERFPLTANGKLDRRALEKVRTQGDEARTYEQPQTPAEELLAGIWSQVLKTGQIGRSDNFFHRGGHSLLAMQLASRIKTVFGLDIPHRSIFKFATVASLAAHIQSQFGNSMREQAPPLRRWQRRVAPVGMAQYRLWFLQQLEPQSWTYNVPIRLRFTGPLGKRLLERALEEIIRRHEVLRTSFRADTDGGLPVQVIEAPRAVEVQVIDCETALRDGVGRTPEEIIREQIREPFDLQQGPLLRALLLRVRPDEHIFVLVIHHIVCDGWSFGVLAHELRALYNAFSRGEGSPLPELPVQYSDYVAWQREWLAGQVLADQLDYWKQQLAQRGETLALPAIGPRPPVTTGGCGRVHFELDAETYARWRELSQREGVTLFMSLLAALTALLHRYTGQRNIVVGTPVASRAALEVEKLIGFFVNTLALRCDLGGNPSVHELLGRVREVALGAYAHQDVPFEKVVEELQPERSLSNTPLFQVMLVMDNAAKIDWRFKDMVVVAEEIHNESAKCDLTVTVRPGAGLEGDFAYRSDVFDRSGAEQMTRHFVNLLRQMVVNEQSRLGDLCFLSGPEYTQVVMEWNRTGMDYPQTCIHELFEQQAARTPSALAAGCGTQRLTYAELNRQSNQLAYYLRKRGVGPEKLVGVCMERSLDMLVVLVAILKAGGAYVPLDPRYPAERLAFILKDTQADLVVTEEKYLELMASCAPDIVLPAKAREAIAAEGDANPAATACPENIAYVIYTSGSTGRPKGVAIEHRNAALLLFWARDVFPPEDLAGVLAATSICFDLSVFEIFAPLAWGGTVFLASSVLELPEVAAANDIFLVNSVPSLIAELVRNGKIPASVRTVNLAGEPLSAMLVSQLYLHENIKKVFDLYGPSEDTTYSTFALRSATAPATIGRPLANKTTYILDPYQQPVPVGVAGELYIGGDGVSRGYLRQPGLTAEKFLPDPFSGKAGARLYRTGDEARHLPDGNLEFRGRIDQQVKIRGFRIELGEIESVLRTHRAVQQAAVIDTEETSGGKRLVAYVVPEAGHAVEAEDLRSFLRQKLPDFMVPSFFIALRRLPVNNNGKLDRQALPKPERIRGCDYTAPRGDLEKLLAACWAELLGVERAGVHDNFFDVGGHSLLLVTMQSRLERALQRSIPILTLFQYPTIGSLAAYLSRPAETTTAAPAIVNGKIRHGAQRLARLRTTRKPDRKWSH
jgi:amino acid adenylation domain-containing protein